MWLAIESGWARSIHYAICSGKLCGGFIISQLPKLCVKIRILMQGHVLIADWSVAHFVVATLDVMNDVMNNIAHVGARLGAFFYWTRFLENNVPFDNIPL